MTTHPHPAITGAKILQATRASEGATIPFRYPADAAVATGGNS